MNKLVQDYNANLQYYKFVRRQFPIEDKFPAVLFFRQWPTSEQGNKNISLRCSID